MRTSCRRADPKPRQRRSALSKFLIGCGGALALILLSAADASAPVHAASPGGGVSVGPSGNPVPRFVSLKAGRVNVRSGPGEDYKVAWIFTRPGLPIEVVQEFDNWRRIRDSDGAMGWVFHSLLAGKRTAVVTPWAKEGVKPLRGSPKESASITAYLEPGVLADIERCSEGWCSLRSNRFRGWIAQEQLWGVYPGETVD